MPTLDELDELTRLQWKDEIQSAKPWHYKTKPRIRKKETPKNEYVETLLRNFDYIDYP